MSKIVRLSMRQQVYNIIKKRILSQEYDLGDPINIVALSRELSASNTPIREAVTMLCAEGLVTSSVNQQFRVVELSEESICELNQTIYILLSGAYRSCVLMNKTEELSALLEKAYARQQKAYEKNNQLRYIQDAIAFDRCFVSVLGNSRLLSVFSSLSDMLFLSVRYAYQHTKLTMEENMVEHQDLMNAMKNQEHSRMEPLLFHHYDKHYNSDDTGSLHQ